VNPQLHVKRASRRYGCRHCYYQLNRFIDEAGVAVYRHPAELGRVDHPPQPAPVGRLDGVRLPCDFCGTVLTPLLAVYTAPEFSIFGIDDSGEPTPIPVGDYGGDWLACATCCADLATGNIDHLLDNASVAGRSPTVAAIGTVMHRFVAATAGSSRRVSLSRDWPAQLPEPGDLYAARAGLGRLLSGGDDIGWDSDMPVSQFAAAVPGMRMYVVDAEYTDLASTAAGTLPPTSITGDLPPSASGLLAWHHPADDQSVVSWAHRPGGWQITWHRPLGVGGLARRVQRHVRDTVGWLLPAGTTTLSIGQTIDAAHPAARLAATWLLMTQPGITSHTDVAAPARAATGGKQPAATKAPAEHDLVRLVQIRGHRPAGTATPPRTRSTTARKQPDERSVVPGHWRNQAYGPGWSKRRPQWIDEYLRGPDGAPVKASHIVRVLARIGPTPPPEPPADPNPVEGAP
jgi:hypothetical protein